MKKLSILAIVILFTFWDLPRTFYQQDEWQTIGHNFVEGIENVTRYTSPIKLFFAEGRPLNRALNLLFFGFFKFNVAPVAIFSITIHFLNTLLVFFLVKRLFQKTTIPLLASLFFAVNSVSHQAVTWAATAAVLPATNLILFSVLAYLEFLEQQEKKWLYSSFALAILSLFFKETGLFLFIFLPLLFFIFTDKNKRKATLKDFFNIHLPLFAYGGLLLAFRLMELFLRTEPVAGFVVGGSKNFIGAVIFHLILYPLTSLFQIFIPPLDFYQLMPILTKIQYKFLIGSPMIDLVAQSIVADMVAIVGSMAILGLLMLLINKSKDTITKRNVLFALAFLFLSFLPYAVLHRDSSYLSSRYFYVGAISGGIIFAHIVVFFANFSKYLKWAVLGLAALYLYYHASIIRNDINYQVDLGKERKAILESIKNIYLRLENLNVFYITGDKDYYITDNKLPMQQGIGYTLAVWFYDTGKIPLEILKNDFLWNMNEQGYRDINGKGFGYFWNLEEMVEIIKDKNLPLTAVHAFFYEGEKKQLVNKTDEVREKLEALMINRK